MTRPQLVVGLGNPGERYARTRHNVGFRVVEELARRAGVDFTVIRNRFAVAEVPTPSASWILLKPLAYMNRSGRALRDWSAQSGWRLTAAAPVPAPPAGGASGRADGDATAGDEVVPASESGPPDGKSGAPDRPLRPLVICDDLALQAGALRIRARGSAGGQKGLASLISVLGGEEFPRVRLGVGDPEDPVPPEAWSDYVLEEFPADQRAFADEVVAYAADAVTAILREGVARAADRFNRRRAPTDGGGETLPAGG